MAGQQYLKTAPGKPAAASASRRSRTTALARLEPQRTSACLYPARAAPTPRRAPAAFCRIPTHHGRDPLPGAACATVASRGLSGSLAMHARKLLGKSRSCCLASQQTLPPHSVSLRRNFALPRRSTFSDKLASPSESFWPRFSAGSHFFLSSAWFALLPPVWLDLPDSPTRPA
jgi:hypothetical protein